MLQVWHHCGGIGVDNRRGSKVFFQTSALICLSSGYNSWSTLEQSKNTNLTCVSFVLCIECKKIEIGKWKIRCWKFLPGPGFEPTTFRPNLAISLFHIHNNLYWISWRPRNRKGWRNYQHRQHCLYIFAGLKNYTQSKSSFCQAVSQYSAQAP